MKARGSIAVAAERRFRTSQAADVRDSSLTSETYGHIAEDHRVREADTRLALGLGRSGPKDVLSGSEAVEDEQGIHQGRRRR